MDITEVRIKLMADSDDRLQGFCSITFDNSFVVRDLKIIEGSTGPFVAMPSRKLTGHCHNCGSKNHLKANYCNQCGGRQRETPMLRDADGRAKLYADIAHPINSVCREMIQSRVIAEFRVEVERAKQPDYVSRYDDDYDDDLEAAPPRSSAPPLPPGSHIEPGATEIRAPHIQTAPASPSRAESSPPTSAVPQPHMPPAAKPQREAAPAEPAAQPPPRKSSFGDGIF